MLIPGESEHIMMKGTEVEVCSEEEGFEGAWFRAVLEESTTKTGRKRIRCRYLTLLSEDRLSCLVEMIEQKFIRPIPKEEDYGSVKIEKGVVVDADHKDGWWTGVVVKEMDDEEFLVSFEVPPDIIKFGKMQLRAHLDWNGWKWNVPEKKVLDESVFSPGAMVEVRSVIDKAEEAWVPALLVTETEEDGEKKFLVKNCNKHMSCNGEESNPNTLVDAHRVRPTPPPFTVEQFRLLERVEAFHGSQWRKGLVRGVLSDNSYMVSFEGTKGESVFKPSSIRPLRVWEDGFWRDGPKGNPIEDTPSIVMNKKPTCSASSANSVTSKKATKHVKRSLNSAEGGETFSRCRTVAATRGLRKKNVDTVNDTTPLVKTPQVTSIANEAMSPVTPSSTVITTPLKPTGTEFEGQKSTEKTPVPTRNQNSCGNDSTQQSQNSFGNNSTQQKVLEEEKSEDASRKRKRNEQDNVDIHESGRTSNGSKAEANDTNKKNCNNDGVDDQPLSPWIRNLSSELAGQSPNVAAATHVEGSQAKDSLMALPFKKKSPYWKICESRESFKSVPQRPHFSPLLEASDDLREYSAVGMMVTYHMSLDEVKALKLNDPSSKLYELSASFAKLEKYGFDIATPQARISKVLSLQDERAKKAEERKRLENKIEEDKNEKRKMEEKRAELKRKILELQRENTIAEEMEEAAAKRIVDMKANAATIDQEIEDMEVECEKTISDPW